MQGDKQVVAKLNDTFLQISCEKHIAYELNEYFSFKIPNAQFHPKVKARMWDGKIRLFNIQTGQLYFGLLRLFPMRLSKCQLVFGLRRQL